VTKRKTALPVHKMKWSGLVKRLANIKQYFIIIYVEDYRTRD